MLTVKETAEDAIRHELGPGEELLWVGRPRQGIVLRGEEAFLIPFSLLWGGFAIFFEVTAIRTHGSWSDVVLGLGLVLPGLYLIFGRFWVDIRQRARAIYAITSERVIIRSGLWSQKVASLSLDSLSGVSLSERRNGVGTITFGPLAQFHGWYGGANWPRTYRVDVPTFDMLDNAREVYEILCKAKQQVGQSV